MFATVAQSTTPTSMYCSGRTSQQCDRLSNSFWRESNMAWKIFTKVMCLLILNMLEFSMIHLSSFVNLFLLRNLQYRRRHRGQGLPRYPIMRMLSSLFQTVRRSVLFVPSCDSCRLKFRLAIDSTSVCISVPLLGLRLHYAGP